MEFVLQRVQHVQIDLLVSRAAIAAHAELRKRLIVQLIQVKDFTNAKKEMEIYVQRFPADSFMRQMLVRAQAIGQSQ